jgi:hypothetical protein
MSKGCAEPQWIEERDGENAGLENKQAPNEEELHPVVPQIVVQSREAGCDDSLVAGH